MGNCLVTKLKGTVDNNNLHYLGELRVKCLEHENPNAITTFISVSGTDVSLKLLSGTYTDKTHIPSGSTGIFTPIYNVTAITQNSQSQCRIETPPHEVLKWSLTSIKEVYFAGTFDFAEVSKEDVYPSVTNMFIRSNVIFDIDNVNASAFPNINSIRFYNGRCVGNVVGLAEFPNLTSFATGDGVSHTITGFVEDLAEALVAKGRTGQFSISKKFARRNGSTTTQGWHIIIDSSYSEGYTIEEGVI